MIKLLSALGIDPAWQDAATILLIALIVLDLAALRWGVDSRTPLLLRNPDRHDM